MKATIQKLSLRTYFLPLLFAALFISCDKDNQAEDLFGNNADARLEQQEKELREALLSSEHGWKLIYFTDDPRYTGDDQQLGGWTFLFDFNDNKHVSMASDFSAETLTPQESEYDVKLGSTTKLSFVTKNYIHLLSDSNNYPTSNLNGQGYKGDFEFLYYGKDGEDLIFRSNRFQIELRFQKATAEDWVNLEDARQTAQLIANSDIKLQINNGGETSEYELSYGVKTRYVQNKDESDLSFGIAPLADGLKIVKPIPVGDQKAINFVYDQANSWFISQLENGGTAKIILTAPEPTVHLFEEEGAFTFQLISFMLESPTSEAFITDVLDPTYVNIDENTNLQFGGFFITLNSIQYLLYDANDNPVYAIHNITYTLDSANNRIILSDAGWNGSDGTTYGSLLQPLDDVLLDPAGFVMEDLGMLSGYPAFSITSYSNPDIVFIVLGGF